MFKTFGKSLLVGIAVALGGMYFMEYLSAVLNGLDRDTMRILMLGAYLCIVLVTCTGMILGQIKQIRNAPPKQEEHTEKERT